jgi:phenylacetate-CoA ligase
VLHAARSVPYYQRWFAEAKLDPHDIRSLRDLALLPPSSRENLQRVPLSDRVARGVPPDSLVRHSTSGSNGEPLVVLRSRLEEALAHGYQLRSQLMMGVPVRARRAKVGKTYSAGLIHRLGFLPTVGFDPLAQPPGQLLEQLREWRADCIDLRPGILEILVEEAERDGQGQWPWRWIVCGGEVLYPELLQRAERVFGARILERYGAHEVGHIAWRCGDCDAMHASDDSVVVEILKDGRCAAPGETGEVVVTSLLSFNMPFLRYGLGDLAEQPPRAAPCGFTFSRIGAIQGRQIDNFTLSDGRLFPSFGLMAAVRKSAGVKRFQLIQESFDEIRIRYVGEPEVEIDLVQNVREALPAPMKITAERVALIQPAPSGKFRCVQSLLASERPFPRTRP